MDADVERMRFGGENGLSDLRDVAVDSCLEEHARVWRNRMGGSSGRLLEMYAGAE
jgi:hypothetical protein